MRKMLERTGMSARKGIASGMHAKMYGHPDKEGMADMQSERGMTKAGAREMRGPKVATQKKRKGR